ncbi:histamine H2 receptor-like [Actinia tenebrosa]|uniref:Histamine H2 receptor-like n=1 Tax=Actinia tenebrosa TaxID=6105 RepID=A0A6P8HN34_ACTTE|nr:histamine H2 receptor-like [Actinia tenebrosa]
MASVKNNSIFDIESEGMRELRDRTLLTIVLETGILLLIDGVSLIGNLVICCAMFKNPRLHTVTNLYILSLAITDIMMALIVMPASFGTLVTSRWAFGPVVCNIQGLVILSLAFVSSLTIGLMSLNRYFRVVRPNTYRLLFTVKKSVSMILIAWGVVFLFVLLPVVCGQAFFVFRPKRSSCFMKITIPLANKAVTASHLVLFVILPMITVFFSYSKVFIAVRRHSALVVPSLQTANESGATGITVEEIKITKVLFAIVLGFLICWCPVLIIEFFNTSLPDPSSLDRWVYLLCNYLWYTSAAINPIIYGAMNRPFRTEAVRVLSKASRARKQSLADEHEV